MEVGGSDATLITERIRLTSIERPGPENYPGEKKGGIPGSIIAKSACRRRRQVLIISELRVVSDPIIGNRISRRVQAESCD